VEARLMRARIAEELAFLREHYADVEHLEHAGEDWFKLPRHFFPPGWRIGETPVETSPIVFRIVAGYPTAEPYGFVAPAGINYKGSPPGNPGSAVAVPFPGEWQHFSWAPDGTWAPSNDVGGSNLLVWVRSFAHRLTEGP
jgi:hypothetical protein